MISIPFPPMAESGASCPSLVRHDPRTPDRGRAGPPGRIGGRRLRRVQLIASKVGSPYVQGQTKAGGWSQRRTPGAGATRPPTRTPRPPGGRPPSCSPPGGSRGRRSRAAIGPGWRRCWPTRAWPPLRAWGFGGVVLPTPDPRLRVLQAFGDQYRAVTITLNDLA